jgi:hypothetical protein
MKSKGKRDEPDTGGCDPAPPEIADDDATSRDAIHLTKNLEGRLSGEMVQELGAHHNVDRLVAKWQTKAVGTNRMIDRPAACQ